MGEENVSSILFLFDQHFFIQPTTLFAKDNKITKNRRS